MRTIIIAILLLTFISCSEDIKIGEPIEIIEDYILPQGNAPQSANNRIQKIYDTYGSYILYNYTATDAFWSQSTGSASAQTYVATLGDPQLTDQMLDYIDDIWLKFFPEEFLKKGGLPYRVFLADSLYWDRGTWIAPQAQMIRGNAVIIPGMNESLSTMSSADKISKRNAFISAMWDYYIAQGLLDIPAEFYEGMDYTNTPPQPSVDMLGYRKRGFLPMAYYTNYPPEEVLDYGWASAKANDLKSYLMHLRQRTDEQMEEFLTNPDYEFIQKRWSILVNYYKDKYNIDFRMMANTTY